MNNGKKIEEAHFARHLLLDEHQPRWRRYAALVTGKSSLGALLAYEVKTGFLGGIPGATGLFVRGKLYPSLFKRAGPGLNIGRSVVIRHADKIALGANVTLDDYCVLDGRGAGEEGLLIGDNAIIGRAAIVQSKLGSIRLGNNCNIGAQSVVISQGDRIDIEDWCQIAGGCKISGGRFKLTHDPQDGFPYERESGGPIRIATGCFLGMGVIVSDGASIGAFSTIGSGAVISQSVPAHAIVMPRPPVIVGSTAPSQPQMQPPVQQA